MKKYRIGDIVDSRPDGSFIYMSSRGILNVDSRKELEEAIREDNSLTSVTRNDRCSKGGKA